MTTARKYCIKELNLDMIHPNAESIKTDIGGYKITIIGAPGSGKSMLIKALLHSKRHIIPTGVVVSGSEETNQFYSTIFPKPFIYDQFQLSIIDDIHRRQKLAKKQLSNPWSVLVLDDCMSDVKVFSDPIMIGLMKNSRHWNLFSIFANQYVLDFKPVIRGCIDGVFIFRENRQVNRKKIYDNFASVIPTFQLFCHLLDKLTVDHTCLYIQNNQTTSNDWQDCVYYYKAPIIEEDFKFGCADYWNFAENRAKSE